MSNDIQTSQCTKELIDCNNNSPIGLDYLNLLEARDTLQFRFENSGKEVEIKRGSLEKIIKLSHEDNQNQKEKIENKITKSAGDLLKDLTHNTKEDLDEKITINCSTLVGDVTETMQHYSESNMKNENDNRINASQGEELDNKVNQEEEFKKIIILENECKSEDVIEPGISVGNNHDEVSIENRPVINEGNKGVEDARENRHGNLNIISDGNRGNLESKPISHLESCNSEEGGLAIENGKLLRFEAKNIENICSSSIYDSELVTDTKNKSFSYNEGVKESGEDGMLSELNQQENEEQTRVNVAGKIRDNPTKMSSTLENRPREILQVGEIKYNQSECLTEEIENRNQIEMLNSQEIDENLCAHEVENNFLNISGTIKADYNEGEINFPLISNEQKEGNITISLEIISENEKIEEVNNRIIREDSQTEEVKIDMTEINTCDDGRITQENPKEEVDILFHKENHFEEVIVHNEFSGGNCVNDRIILEDNTHDGQSLDDNKPSEIVKYSEKTILVENFLNESESQLNKSIDQAIINEENNNKVVDEHTDKSLIGNIEKETFTEFADQPSNGEFLEFHRTNQEEKENIFKEDSTYLSNTIEKHPLIEEGDKNQSLNVSPENISTIPPHAEIDQPLKHQNEKQIIFQETFNKNELISQSKSKIIVHKEGDFQNLHVDLLEIGDINSEETGTHHINQHEINLYSEESPRKIIALDKAITLLTESIDGHALRSSSDIINKDKNSAIDKESKQQDQENHIEEQNSFTDEEITNQSGANQILEDELLFPTNQVNNDTNIQSFQVQQENDHSINTDNNQEVEMETINIDEQIHSEDNYRISQHDTNKNQLFESNFNYMTINLEIPDNRTNFFTEVIDTTLPIENMDDTRPECDENSENLKKRMTRPSEYYQYDITRYGNEESKLNDTQKSEKSFENKKLIVMDKAYITDFSSNPYYYKSSFLTNKYDDMEHEEHNLREDHGQEEYTEDKMSDIDNIEADRDEHLTNLDHELDIVKIESYTTEFNMQNEIAIEEIKYDEVMDIEENNYTGDVDDVVNYDNIKSPVIKRMVEENNFKFELLDAKDTDHLEHTPTQAIDIFDFNLTEKKTDYTPDQLIKTLHKERDVTNTPLAFNEVKDSSNRLTQSYTETNTNHQQQVYIDYKTNIENDLFISVDQYKTDLIEDITEDDKIEKIQQIQESAKRQYELLTKASSLETIHEVRSVIFNVDTDDEKIKRKRTREIIILDGEDEEDNVLLDEGIPKEKKSFRKNSLVCVSRLSLKTLKEDKLYTTTTVSNEAASDKKSNLKPLVESKRSSAKLFNTKKWDSKQLQADIRLKQIGLKIAPIKIPPRPKLIPNSNHTEKAGCFSPKPTKRSTMPFIKEMGSIDLCFVCKGAVVKPKQCKRCMKCVCHVCSFELKDRTKCPDCNCILVLMPKNGGSTTTMASHFKKFSMTEKKSQATTSIFGKREGGRSSALNLKNKPKNDTPANCCNCNDSTIASINCQKCGKSSCVMCLNNSNDSGKCLSCKANFKTRYSSNLGNNPQTLTRKLSQSFRKTPTAANAGTKLNQKMFHTASTKAFTTACGICKKSTSNKNKCLNCPKNICSLCYGNIDGEKTCTDCHLWSKLKLNSKQKISAIEQKYRTTKNSIRPNSRQLDPSNPSNSSKNVVEKIVKCLNCKKNKKCCKECLKTICVICKKDSFDKNRCSECRKKPKGNILQRISKSDSDSQLLFDDICLICKVTTNEKISCNNCLKSICNTCVDIVKQNDNKCPNCSNTSYTVMSLSNYNNNFESAVNDSNSHICASPEKGHSATSPENEIKKEESTLIEPLCLICARTPYNNLTCNKCNNEVCFTCTYAMKEQFQCPKCPGLLTLKEKKENLIASNDSSLLTPKKLENGYFGTNPDSSSPNNNPNEMEEAQSPNSSTNRDNICNPIRLIRLDNSEQTLPIEIPPNTKDTQAVHLLDNCLICKGSPIKPKSCTSCHKPVCKMCSYEIEDNKCPGCDAELDLVDGLSERNDKSYDKINADIKIENSSITDACLVCKGFPIKPKSCENCHKSVCTICSYELEDPSKCKECKGPYKKISLRNQSKYFTGIASNDERKSIADSIHGNGPCCVVCKRPPFKAKICWSCMTAIFCTPCSFNFEDSNRCLNCQGPLNKELVIKPLNTSRFNLHSSGIKYDGQQVNIFI